MVTIGIAELKARLSQHLDRVKAGGEIVITEHGQPIARILPLAESRLHDSRVRELVRRGAARLPDKALSSAAIRELARMPRPRVAAGAAERALEAEREDRL